MKQVAKSIDQIEAELNSPKEDKRSALKKLLAVRDPNGLYSIAFTSGGEVPDALKGRWTSIVKAEAAIENYLATSAA